MLIEYGSGQFGDGSDVGIVTLIGLKIQLSRYIQYVLKGMTLMQLR